MVKMEKLTKLNFISIPALFFFLIVFGLIFVTSTDVLSSVYMCACHSVKMMGLKCSELTPKTL